MRVGVPKENRRAASAASRSCPRSSSASRAKGIEVVVEPGAGAGALIPDAAVRRGRAPTISATSGAPTSSSRSRRRPPRRSAGCGDGSILVGFLAPAAARPTTRAARSRGAGVDRVRDGGDPAHLARPVDGRAVLAGQRRRLQGGRCSRAEQLGRFFPMLMTAAGTIPPAKVLVLGAGVAGLQALATARRLGAQTTGYDVRPEVAEQVQSLGAQFLDLGIEAAGEGGYARELTDEERAQQQQALTDAIKGFDVVITTALVPGRPAPRLVTAEAVEGMKPGSVIVDLAGETGGNCELTEPGETVVTHDVTIVSPLNLPSTMPEHASQLYARNVQALLELARRRGRRARSWTSTTRSSPARASRATARSSTRRQAGVGGGA